MYSSSGAWSLWLTQSPRPKERVDEFRSIKAHEGHGIAGTYTSFRQDGRREVGPGLHFSVGNGDVSRAKERLVVTNVDVGAVLSRALAM